MKLSIVFIMSILLYACNSQERNVRVGEKIQVAELDSQIGEYVTSVYEDSKGDLWFGTLQKGIARYNRESLRYLTEKDGLPSSRVPGVIEDANGNYWFITGSGLSKYDGKTFENFAVNDGDASNLISNLFIDSKQVFWVGTWGGLYQFDGSEFSKFDIPYPEVKTKINQDTKNWIKEIEEDDEGNIWIGRDGYGICKYDGKTFTHILKQDGLHSNNITEIEIDEEGSVWIGTRVAEKDNPDPNNRKGKGGINKLTEGNILSFPKIAGFNNGDVYGIYKDRLGNIWISTIKNGVYKYDGNKFHNYKVPISVMGMLYDQQGVMWLGGAGGLFKIDQDEKIVNVSVNGPWQ